MESNDSTRAERARAAVIGELREEMCISLPVPVMWEGTWADAFFTFTISTVGMFPYPARDCRIVTKNGNVVVEENAFDIQFQPHDTSMDTPIEGWDDAYECAYQTYDAAFKELEEGNPAEACAAYAAAVTAATPQSQMVYYQALNGTLFPEVDA